MKKLFTAIVLFTALSQSTSFAGETFEVDGAQAANIQKALIAMGAHTELSVDTLKFTVNQVDCSAGFFPGHGAFENCSFQQLDSIPGSHAMVFRTFQAHGAKAEALINALEAAGVKGQQEVEMKHISLDRITSFSLAFDAESGIGKSCQLTLAE